MLKQTITYTDYNGNERTEDYYFALNKAELVKMNAAQPGGLANFIERIAQTQDVGKLIKIFEDLIQRAYGEKSDDGRRFMKSPEITANFVQTEAYSQLFMKLATDDKAATEFIKGIIPSDLAAQVEAAEKNGNAPMTIG